MRRRVLLAFALTGWMAAALTSVHTTAAQSQTTPAPAVSSPIKPVVDTYCVTCHNQRTKTAGLSLEGIDTAHPEANAEVWERVIAKLRAGAMPPPGLPRPDTKTYTASADWLEREIDRAWVGRPDPGRSSAVQRLNRTEYNNAV